MSEPIRKVVSIRFQIGNDDDDGVVVAVCDDGTIWMRSPDVEWVQVPGPPGTIEIKEEE